MYFKIFLNVWNLICFSAKEEYAKFIYISQNLLEYSKFAYVFGNCICRRKTMVYGINIRLMIDFLTVYNAKLCQEKVKITTLMNDSVRYFMFILSIRI